MSGDKPSVGRGGSEAAARAAGMLNWLAIGGLVCAAASGVIAVRPAAPLAPGSQVFAVDEVRGTDGTVNSFAGSLPVMGTRDAGAEAQGVAAHSDVPAEPLPMRDSEYASQPKEKQRRSRQAAQSQPQEKASEAVVPAPQANAPASVDANTAWSEGEIRAAREECTALMGKLPAEWSVASPMRTMSCGAPGPITLNSVGTAKVALVPPATTNCSTAAALARWMDEHVQPAAMKHFGARVARVTIATSYDCRNRYGQKQAPLSEHALANALDLSGFKLTDGRTVNVLGGWGPTARSTQALPVEARPDSKASAERQGRMGLGAQSADVSAAAKAKAASAPPGPSTVAKGPEAEFLRSVHASACTVFGTVLGPEANEAHRDHFHLDMKYRRRSSFCQ